MRDVAGGWIIRYMHSTGASMFFVVVYLHMFRGLLYGSYRQPRELVMDLRHADFPVPDGGSVPRLPAPWGQMSFWGAQVIVKPVLVDSGNRSRSSVFIRGDFVVSDAT